MKIKELLESKKIESLEFDLNQAYRMIHELIGGLDCDDKELRMLTRDVAVDYLKAIQERHTYNSR